MATTHSPLGGTVKVSPMTSDAFEAVCVNCDETIVQWDFVDDDGDRRRRVFEDWAVETQVRVNEQVWRIKRDLECKG